MIWQFLLVVWAAGAIVTYYKSSKAVERVKEKSVGPLWLLYLVHIGTSLLWPIYWIRVRSKIREIRKGERE